MSKYLQVLQSLLPQGEAWNREPGTVLTKLLTALSEEPERVEQRALDLLNEADPRTATEMLDEWERLCGIPKEATTEQRRAAIHAKLQGAMGQSEAIYHALAATVGYDICIDRNPYRPYKMGISRMGDRIGNLWTYVFNVYYVNDTNSNDALLERILSEHARLNAYINFIPEDLDYWIEGDAAIYNCIDYHPTDTGDLIYACGMLGHVAKSEDAGETWSLETLSTSQDFKRITGHNDEIVVVGAGGTIFKYHRVYGTWVQITADASYTGMFQGIAWDDVVGGYVAVGSAGGIQLIVGLSAAAQTPANGFSNHFYSVASGNSIIVAVGSVGEIQTSTDGVNWTKRTSNTTANLHDVFFHDGTFVAVGSSGQAVVSNDGITWQQVSMPNSYTGQLWKVIHNGRLHWMAVGEAGGIFTSRNGLTWQQRTPDNNYPGMFFALYYKNGFHLFAGTYHQNNVDVIQGPSGGGDTG